MKLKKMLALLLAAVMLLLAAAGCAKEDPNAITMVVDGEKYTFSTALTVNGEEVSAKMFKYYYGLLRDDYDQGDASFWEENPEAAQDLMEEVLYYLKQVVLFNNWAEEYNVALTEEEIEASKKVLADARASYETEEEYLQDLAAMYLDEETYLQVYQQDILFQRVYDTMLEDEELLPVDEAKVIADLEAEYVRVTHICCFFEEESEETEESEEAEESEEDDPLLQLDPKARIDAIKALLDEGEDYIELAKKYNQDSTLDGLEGEGYVITINEFDENFAATAFALEVGEISDVIETEYGYHILMRLPLGEFYDNNKEAIFFNTRVAMLTDYMAQVVAEAQTEWSEEALQVNPTATFE